MLRAEGSGDGGRRRSRAEAVLPITAPIDHRWVDGYGISGLPESFQKYLANPLAREA